MTLNISPSGVIYHSCMH